MAVILIIIFLWLIGLTGVVFRLWQHYNRLTAGLTQKGLIEVLDNLLKQSDVNKREIAEVEAKLVNIVNEGRSHVQRVGIVRFNPFADTGGSQSFTVAILDGDDNGIVMTNLYARNSNRWYLKEVKNGKSKGLDLSREEEAAIKRARLLAKNT